MLPPALPSRTRRRGPAVIGGALLLAYVSFYAYHVAPLALDDVHTRPRLASVNFELRQQVAELPPPPPLPIPPSDADDVAAMLAQADIAASRFGDLEPADAQAPRPGDAGELPRLFQRKGMSVRMLGRDELVEPPAEPVEPPATRKSNKPGRRRKSSSTPAESQRESQPRREGKSPPSAAKREEIKTGEYKAHKKGRGRGRHH
mmetsp:Transcript_31073/g.99375  ORF Transcript_31073/g.99375 Transcript_31073/m.99375 type:complete len:203 (+) Transcript_31073:26-634(+)